MPTPSSPAPHGAQHPVLIAAAVAVIVFCGAGTAAIMGWIPSSLGTPVGSEAGASGRAALAPALPGAAPRTLAALEAQGSDAESAGARYRAESQAASQAESRAESAAEKQRMDALYAGRERAERRDAAEHAARKAAPAPRHAASEAGGARWCTHCGNIESVREITQRAQGSGLGAAGGALLGGLLGNQVGGGNGRKLATVAGAVGGAVAGNQVEGNLKATRSYEIRVRLDDGGARTFHQHSAAGWRTGDRVKVVNGTLRPVA